MKDQVDTLVGNGVPAALYNSSLSSDEKNTVTTGLREGRYRLLYVSPERLAGEGGDGFVNRLSKCDVQFIAVDEAHCISQWGHDFRPEYRQLGRLRSMLPGVSLHAYTATATARVRRDIASQLGLEAPLELVGSFDRPNLIYRVLARASLKRQILDVMARRRGQAGIIYCTSRREVDALAAWLVETGVRAKPYHAGLADSERSRNQDAFLDEHADVVVATVAFGMGIDRSDVRFVVHAGAPQSLEHYQQESGRAGRDGLEAECVLIYSTADFMKWRVMLERNGELNDARRSLLRDIERYASSVGCRHRHLIGYFGETYTKSDCGACDYCLDELETVTEPVMLARKILSCVARVGQRFGATHVTNVLRGSESDAISARRHDQLSTFGLLKDMSVPEVRGYIEQLSGLGLLRQTDSEFPVLELTEDGVTLLKNADAQPGLVWRGNGARARTALRSAYVASRPKPGRTSTAISSSACAQFAWRSHARAAFHRTSSSTTPPCATWHACGRRRWKRCAASRVSASARPPTWGRRSSPRFGAERRVRRGRRKRDYNGGTEQRSLRGSRCRARGTPASG